MSSSDLTKQTGIPHSLLHQRKKPAGNTALSSHHREPEVVCKSVHYIHTLTSAAREFAMVRVLLFHGCGSCRAWGLLHRWRMRVAEAAVGDGRPRLRMKLVLDRQTKVSSVWETSCALLRERPVCNGLIHLWERKNIKDGSRNLSYFRRHRCYLQRGNSERKQR